MAIIEDLLEYQKIDGELREIEKELSASEERKKYIQAKKFMETAPEKLEAQDKRAQELKTLSQKLMRDFEEISKAVAEYEGLEEMLEDGGDVSFYKKNVQSLIERLRITKGELTKLMKDVESASEEYKKMKKATISMQKQYKEYSEKFKELKGSKATEVDEITSRLEKVGKKLPPEILAKYNAKRRERIFPIVAPTGNDTCICGMDFSIAKKGELDSGNVIECENCRRFIYKSGT